MDSEFPSITELPDSNSIYKTVRAQHQKKHAMTSVCIHLLTSQTASY